ncbi:MAG: helix-hairpin-helix domain-containing protein [Rikenellaceae bacterium]
MRELGRIYGFGMGFLLLLTGVILWGSRFIDVGEETNDYARQADSTLLRKKAQRVIPRARYRPKRTYQYPTPVPIELNQATKQQLQKIYGIGEILSDRIIEYREKLGGFVRVEQLKEIKGINSENFRELGDKFFVDTAVIQKININFATRNTLVSHPYVTNNMAGRITKGAKMKGVIVNNQQLIDSDILTPAEARKLAPYLSYDTIVHQ